jgi:hypothetical protein
MVHVEMPSNFEADSPCPLYPQKQTCSVQFGMSAWPKADIQRRVPALALEQAFCIYLDCRRSPLFLSVCDTPNSSKANKKERGAWTLLKLLCR